MNVKKIQDALAQLKNGGLVIVMDDQDREAEGGYDRSRQQGNPGEGQFYDQVCAGTDVCANGAASG